MKKLGLIFGMIVFTLSMNAQEVFEFKGAYKKMTITLSENTIEVSNNGDSITFDVKRIGGKNENFETYEVIDSDSPYMIRYVFAKAKKNGSVTIQVKDDFTGKVTSQMLLIKKITQLEKKRKDD
tara:strand:- start:134 stop:505 length:372 start_codon:yes stop_codon:yes gene_type:complete